MLYFRKSLNTTDELESFINSKWEELVAGGYIEFYDNMPRDGAFSLVILPRNNINAIFGFRPEISPPVIKIGDEEFALWYHPYGLVDYTCWDFIAFLKPEERARDCEKEIEEILYREYLESALNS